MEQLELIPTLEKYECDGCDRPGEAPPRQIPEGWIVAAKGIACTRVNRKRVAEHFELHYCGECKLLPHPRLTHLARRKQ